MIYKNGGKSGFAIGTNRFSREDLAAGGITAFALALMALIGLVKPKKAKKKSAFARLFSAPFVFRLAKAGVSRVNLESLAKKAGAGKTVSTLFTDESPESESGDKADDESRSGIEIITSTPIASEEEVYEHI